MNKKRQVFIIYCLIAIFVLLGVIGIMAGYKRSEKASFQPRQKSPAEQAEEKISEYSNPQAVISIHEIKNILGDPNVVILDTRGRLS